jgi:hypothetical protein
MVDWLVLVIAIVGWILFFYELRWREKMKLELTEPRLDIQYHQIDRGSLNGKKVFNQILITNTQQGAAEKVKCYWIMRLFNGKTYEGCIEIDEAILEGKPIEKSHIFNLDDVLDAKQADTILFKIKYNYLRHEYSKCTSFIRPRDELDVVWKKGIDTEPIRARRFKKRRDENDELFDNFLKKMNYEHR